MKSFRMMKTLDVAEARGSLASHPLMVLVPLEEGADVESVSLSMNPEFMAMIERSRALHKPGRGLSTSEMRRIVGVRRKSQRKVG